MGYDLHITRRKDWSATGNDITTGEWLAYLAEDPELSLWPENGKYMVRWSGRSKHSDPWLDWFQGNIYSKNPDPALIDKMVQIALALNAQVQGDDGELYLNSHDPPAYPRPSFLSRVGRWLRALRATPALEPINPPFQVGDRVLDVYGKQTTVTHIEPQSNHHVGKVTVRYDDGREVSLLLMASGLRPLHPRKNSD